MCDKATCRNEVNLVAQYDQEWYFIHEIYIHSQEYMSIEFLKCLWDSYEILSNLDGLLHGCFPF